MAPAVVEAIGKAAGDCGRQIVQRPLIAHRQQGAHNPVAPLTHKPGRTMRGPRSSKPWHQAATCHLSPIPFVGLLSLKHRGSPVLVQHGVQDQLPQLCCHVWQGCWPTSLDECLFAQQGVLNMPCRSISGPHTVHDGVLLQVFPWRGLSRAHERNTHPHLQGSKGGFKRAPALCVMSQLPLARPLLLIRRLQQLPQKALLCW
jgi:hypothetical protein